MANRTYKKDLQFQCNSLGIKYKKNSSIEVLEKLIRDFFKSKEPIPVVYEKQEELISYNKLAFYFKLTLVEQKFVAAKYVNQKRVKGEWEQLLKKDRIL